MQVPGPRFLVSKTRRAVVKFGASDALSQSARLTITVIGQNVSLRVVVKKKIVLVYISYMQEGEDTYIIGDVGCLENH